MLQRFALLSSYICNVVLYQCSVSRILRTCNDKKHPVGCEAKLA